MKIAIASDHRGYDLKSELISYLKKSNVEIIDCGTDSTESVDYPLYAFKLSTEVVNKNVDFGIVICGTGIGISIACNKVKGIRCAKVSTVDEARHTREDNDANVLALHGDMAVSDAIKIVDAFINTDFSNLEKHIRRIKMITEYEDDHNAR